MSAGFPGLDSAPSGLPQVINYLRRIREVVNNILIGKQNITFDVTLAAGATSTIVTDSRIGGNSSIQLGCPRTANAAAALATTYVSSIGNQTATLTHDNNAQTDRTFRLVIQG